MQIVTGPSLVGKFETGNRRQGHSRSKKLSAVSGARAGTTGFAPWLFAHLAISYSGLIVNNRDDGDPKHVRQDAMHYVLDRFRTNLSARRRSTLWMH